MKTKRFFFYLGILVLLLVPVWVFVYLPLATALPVNFSQKAVLTHTEDNRFDINGKWSGKTISISSIEDRFEKTEYNKAYLVNSFTVESLTGEPLFSLNQKFIVDRVTRKNLPGGNDIKGEAQFFFPQNIASKPIYWWPNAFGEPFNMVYVDTVTVHNFRTLHYRGERSDVNDTEGYSFLNTVPEKYQVLSRAMLDVYVDPISGTVIDYQDEGISYYADFSQNPIWDIAKWSNKFSDETINNRIEIAKNTSKDQRFNEVIIPGLLIAISVILLSLGRGVQTNNKHKKRS